jgi:hypothetical protein
LAAAAAISIAALLPRCPDAVHLDQASVQKQNFTSYFCTMPSIKHNNALKSPTVKQLQQLLQQKGLPVTVIGHGIVGKDIPIMARLAGARRWSKR